MLLPTGLQPTRGHHQALASAHVSASNEILTTSSVVMVWQYHVSSQTLLMPDPVPGVDLIFGPLATLQVTFSLISLSSLAPFLARSLTHPLFSRSLSLFSRALSLARALLTRTEKHAETQRYTLSGLEILSAFDEDSLFLSLFYLP